MTCGAALWFNGAGAGPWVVLAGVLVLVYMMFGWFGQVIGESEGGMYRKRVDMSFRWGMSWFIFSEVMFFAAFFGALFYVRVLSVPGLGEIDQKLLWPDFQRRVADRRTRYHGSLHAHGRLGHPGAQHRCCCSRRASR